MVSAVRRRKGWMGWAGWWVCGLETELAYGIEREEKSISSHSSSKDSVWWV